MSTSAAPMVPAGTGTLAAREALAHRCAALRAGIAVLRSVVANARFPDGLDAQIEQLEGKVAALTADSTPDLLESLGAAVGAAERAFLECDAAVPMSWFRRKFDVARIERALLELYAALMARHVALDPERRDRLEFVATRLATRATANGPALRPREEIAALLQQIAQLVSARGTARESARAFFQAAVGRLGQLQTVDELFDANFLLDVRGYKILLKAECFDPDVLYAAMELNLAVAGRLKQLLAEAGRPEEALRDRFAQLDQKVLEIFSTGRRLDRAPKFLGAHAEADAKAQREIPRPVAAFRPAAVRSGRLRTAVELLALLVILVGGGLLLHRAYAGRDQLVQSPAELVQQLSPILQSGAFSRGPDETFFLGQVDPSRWLLLTPAGRQQAARALMVRLGQRNVWSAIVFRGPMLAIQIEHGKVLTVQ